MRLGWVWACMCGASICYLSKYWDCMYTVCVYLSKYCLLWVCVCMWVCPFVPETGYFSKIQICLAIGHVDRKWRFKFDRRSIAGHFSIVQAHIGFMVCNKKYWACLSYFICQCNATVWFWKANNSHANNKSILERSKHYAAMWCRMNFIYCGSLEANGKNSVFPYSNISIFIAFSNIFAVVEHSTLNLIES